MQDFIIEINLENFKSVVELSQTKPVLLDFWASWCGPCKTLVPILEKIAKDFNGDLILAKVNTEENPELSAHFQIRSIPTVMLVKNGGVVDQFNGALPESGVMDFLQKNGVVNELNRILAQIEELNAKADFAQLAEILEEALKKYPQNYSIKLNFARALVRLQKNAQAEEILNSLNAEDKNRNEVKALLASLEFSTALPKESEEELQIKGDIDAKYKLAQINLAKNEYEAGLNYLLEVLSEDKNFLDGKAHQNFLDALGILGNSNPITATYRRKLFTLLH